MRKRPKQWRTAIVTFGMTMLVCGAEYASARDSSSTMHILVFGDSLSEGLFLKPKEAWPALLIPKFRKAGLKAEILNVSKSGDTTGGGLERIDHRLNSKSAGWTDPSGGGIDIFILELGINDAFQGKPVDQIGGNLQEIIDRVKRANPNVRVIICGMKWPDHAPDDYVAAFGEMYIDLAARNNAALVPYLLEGVIGDPALNLLDRFHPNAAGHKILAENVWRVLEPVAREVAQRVGDRQSPRHSPLPE